MQDNQPFPVVNLYFEYQPPNEEDLPKYSNYCGTLFSDFSIEQGSFPDLVSRLIMKQEGVREITIMGDIYDKEDSGLYLPRKKHKFFHPMQSFHSLLNDSRDQSSSQMSEKKVLENHIAEVLSPQEDLENPFDEFELRVGNGYYLRSLRTRKEVGWEEEYYARALYDLVTKKFDLIQK